MSSIARPLSRGLPLGWIAAALVLAIGAAGGSWVLTRAGAEEGLGAARSASARAAEAEAAVAEVADEVAALERRLATVTNENERLAARMGRVTDALWSSLRRVRTDLAAARAGSKEALAGVGAAATEARNAAKELSVLEDRFEYHLRADHGGG